jgi:hypothetical protein
VTWHRGKKAFRLITTCRALRRAESSDIPASSCVYVDEILSLYQRYRKGETPRARDLELDVVDKLTYVDRKRRVKSFLFNAKLSDFRRYLEHNDVARLVARNIRYNLSGRVGRVVRRTYENEPHDFWYLHNGLTMICDEYRESGRHTIIVNPSVVNGAQTLYAIAGSRATRSNALVTTRVVVRRSVAGPVEDDAWLQKVIRGVNTQNRVKAYDFRSNEPEQFELQALFREVKVLFERKRGEWKEHRNDPAFRGFDRLPLFRLGQVLCCSAFTDGKGVLRMKSGLEEVFSNDRQYRALFPPRAQIRRRFPRIYLAYRAYRLLAAYGYGTAKELRRRRHGFWNAFWLFHRGLGAAFKNGSPSVEQIRRMFDAFHGSGRPAQSARKVCRRVTKAVWAAWRIGQKKDRERWTPNNFFKVQYGTAILQRHAFPKVRADIMRLGQMIAAA